MTSLRPSSNQPHSNAIYCVFPVPGRAGEFSEPASRSEEPTQRTADRRLSRLFLLCPLPPPKPAPLPMPLAPTSQDTPSAPPTPPAPPSTPSPDDELEGVPDALEIQQRQH